MTREKHAGLFPICYIPPADILSSRSCPQGEGATHPFYYFRIFSDILKTIRRPHLLANFFWV